MLKSGVNIGADGLKLYRDFGIKTNGLVELKDVAESVKSPKLKISHLRSLRALTGIFVSLVYYRNYLKFCFNISLI